MNKHYYDYESKPDMKDQDKQKQTNKKKQFKESVKTTYAEKKSLNCIKVQNSWKI